MASDTISGALCGVMERALVEKGIDPRLAKALAEKACEPAVAVAGGAVLEGGRRAVKKARKSSAYNRKYKAAFRRIAPKYKLKNGKWKKNGFRLAVKAAHAAARRGRR